MIKAKDAVMIGTVSKTWLGVPLKIEGEVIGVLTVQSYTDENAYNESDQKMLEFVSEQISISIKRKTTEQDLRKALKKAQESDRLKSAFLANMSHEIRTPMNGILGFTSLLKEPKLTGEQQQKYIDIIGKSGDRLLNIINDIITISTIESGRQEISVTKININDQIESIYTFFKPEANKKGIHIFYTSTLPAKEATINTDVTKIDSILTNLVKNAIKFTNAGSIEFGYEKKGKTLEFFVKDTGNGISPERKKIIFERFRQGSEGNTRTHEGAGLGLSISKAYVEILGGKIWVESEEGKGSVFYFTLPYHPEDEEIIDTENLIPAKSVENKTDSEDSWMKILIVEDDEISEMFLKTILKNFGKEFLFAKTGLKAVETCRHNPDIDLVLMDIKMPEMDGYEATRKIRKFNKKVIIISQTAYRLSGDKEKAIEAGCNDYITKPINKTELLALIQKYFIK